MELLRDRSAEVEAAGVRPLAISRDSPWTHIAWMQVLDLNFGLLSDWNAEAVRGFGVARDYRGMKEVAERTAFLVGIDGSALGARDDRGMKEVAERTAFLVGIDGSVLGAWRYEDSEVPDFDVLLAAAQAS